MSINPSITASKASESCNTDLPLKLGVFSAFTDGSCLTNPGPGGCAALIYEGELDSDAGLEGVSPCKLFKSGSCKATNNQMEVLAATGALESFDHPVDITLFSDSQYLVDGVNKYLKNWKANGWKKTNRKPVANIELWMRLDAQLSKHRATFHWVKGHSGVPMNEEADRLANVQAQRHADMNRNWK